MHTKAYIAFYCTLNQETYKGATNLGNNSNKVGRALCNILAEIAKQEKLKAVRIDDYGTALVAALVEGVFKEAERSFT
jgi:hypothetical protein